MSSLVVLEREKLTERLKDPTHSGPKWPQMPNDQQVVHAREEGSHEETFKITQETQKNNKNKHTYKIKVKSCLLTSHFRQSWIKICHTGPFRDYKYELQAFTSVNTLLVFTCV